MNRAFTDRLHDALSSGLDYQSWRQRNPKDEKQNRISKRWQADNPLAVIAHGKVYTALKTGTLKKPAKCAGCNEKRRVEAHHEDYSRPLDVKWLCRSCHRLLHR